MTGITSGLELPQADLNSPEVDAAPQSRYRQLYLAPLYFQLFYLAPLC